MVKVRRSRGSRQGRASLFLVCLSLALLYLAARTTPGNDSLLTIERTTLGTFPMDPEVRAMRFWRMNLERECTEFLQELSTTNITDTELAHKSELELSALNQMHIPDPPSLKVARRPYPYEPCKNVFLDLGTNRGDSIAAAVDASLDVCSQPFLKHDPNILRAYRVSKEFPRLHFDVNDLRIYGRGSQGLSLLKLLQEFFAEPGMESACVYGMEGNPYFTSKLNQLEEMVNQMRPRPLQYLHIDTDTIITKSDGPAELNIDQYSEKNYFWGSSVLESMPDIRKTTRQNNGTIVKAQVQGITLSTLLKKTLLAFYSSVETNRSGGLLMIKMDVEGAEFSVLKELADSGVLCDYLKLGNEATLVVEFHQHLVKNEEEKQEAVDGLREAKEKLKNCGAKFRQLPNFWTG